MPDALAVAIVALLFWGRISELRVFRRAHDAIRAGHPRRALAELRLRRLTRPRFRTPRDVYYEAAARFWRGDFERAVRLTAIFENQSGRLALAARELRADALLELERLTEARLTIEALEHAAGGGGPSSRLVRLQGILAFQEGKLEDGARLLGGSRDAFPPWEPEWCLVRFYLAAIAYKNEAGRDEVRTLLEEAIAAGEGTFVGRVAMDSYEQIFEEPAPRRDERPRPRAWRLASLRDVGRGFWWCLLERPIALRHRYEDLARWLLIDLVWIVVVKCDDYTPGAFFDREDLILVGAPLTLAPVVGYLASLWLPGRDVARRLTVFFLSAFPGIFLLGTLLTLSTRLHLGHGVQVAHVAFAGWLLLVLGRVVWAASPTGSRPARFLSSVVALVASGFLLRDALQTPLWYPPEPSASVAFENRASAYDFEEGRSVERARASLAPERPNVEDIYFVSFAGWGSEDVFMHEAEFARGVMDRRFDTGGRSLVLANDLSAEGRLPGATRRNLKEVLQAVGARMNREEDLLFLFMTSHGSERGLATRAPSALWKSEDEISPVELRGMLDQAGIKWRVVVVGGCRTGVFVPALRSDSAAVFTAASSERNSYGCANGRSFTDFGRALFGEALQQETSFLSAFRTATATITREEADTRRLASQPELFVGAGMEAKLTSVESRFATASQSEHK